MEVLVVLGGISLYFAIGALIVGIIRPIIGMNLGALDDVGVLSLAVIFWPLILPLFVIFSAYWCGGKIVDWCKGKSK